MIDGKKESHSAEHRLFHTAGGRSPSPRPDPRLPFVELALLTLRRLDPISCQNQADIVLGRDHVLDVVDPDKTTAAVPPQKACLERAYSAHAFNDTARRRRLHDVQLF